MAAFVVGLVLLLAMSAHSDASYCVCNSGLSDGVLQKNIDYACGAGADCSAIIQNGACFNPNTVKDHCNYAVNSYYQRKGQITGSCDFQATATVTQTAPNAASGCVYQSSPSTGGSTTPSIGGTPNTGGSTTTPGSTVPGSTGIGLGPTGSGLGSSDNSASVTVLNHSSTFMLVSLTLLVSGLMWTRI
ncbi:plasmodesmata callose-binding protein 2 [Sesamum angolense]|uniref:Plasmodesmata callose-binding protein 2 n=1 Tax=Sesamum angolense TaxID=2727404 RepID=A0AAE2BVZ5_9LAMI|nr:plasmodesmata callose-binding protein 2 [Sesamum angolense]